jgi:hypothetical protein
MGDPYFHFAESQGSVEQHLGNTVLKEAVF